MPTAGFKSAMPAIKRLQIYAVKFMYAVGCLTFYVFLESWKFVGAVNQGYTDFSKILEPPQVLVSRTVTCAKHHAEDYQTLGAMIGSFVVRATWCLGSVDPYCRPVAFYKQITVF